MGNAFGQNTSNKFSATTQAIASVITSSIMNCGSNVLATQSFIVSGNFNQISNVKLVQAIKLSTNCINNAETVAKIQTDVANAIAQQASAQGQALIGALNNSNTNSSTIIKNEVQSHINTSSLTNLISSVQAAQNIIISGNNNIVDNFSAEQTSELVQNAACSLVNNLDSVAKLNAEADQKTTSTVVDPISEAIKGIMSGIQGIGMLWVILILGIIFGVIFLFTSVFKSIFS